MGRTEIIRKRMGLVLSDFPIGADVFFIRLDYLSRPEPKDVAYGELTFEQFQFQGKPVIIVNAPFGVDARKDMPIESEGQVFVRYFINKGYKVPGETWTINISAKDIRENIGRVDMTPLAELYPADDEDEEREQEEPSKVLDTLRKLAGLEAKT